MAFKHIDESKILEFFIENDQLIIEEHDNDDTLLSSYILAIDPRDKLLNYRESTIDDEHYQLELYQDVYKRQVLYQSTMLMDIIILSFKHLGKFKI